MTWEGVNIVMWRIWREDNMGVTIYMYLENNMKDG